MLIQLLEVLKNKRICTLQELAELTNNNIENIKVEIEYLENNGYLVKTKGTETSRCQSQCFGCSNCIVNQDDIWIVKE